MDVQNGSCDDLDVDSAGGDRVDLHTACWRVLACGFAAANAD